MSDTLASYTSNGWSACRSAGGLQLCKRPSLLLKEIKRRRSLWGALAVSVAIVYYAALPPIVRWASWSGYSYVADTVLRKPISSVSCCSYRSGEEQREVTVVTLLVSGKGLQPLPKQLTKDGICTMLGRLQQGTSKSITSCQASASTWYTHGMITGALTSPLSK